MPTTTTNRGLMKQAGTDLANTIDDVAAALADQLDFDLYWVSGVFASRGAAAGKTGKVYYSTDVPQLDVSDGTNWRPLWPVADLAITTAKLAALAVTTAKLADGAATTAKIGTLPAGKMVATAAQTLTVSTIARLLYDTASASGGFTQDGMVASNNGASKLTAFFVPVTGVYTVSASMAIDLSAGSFTRLAVRKQNIDVAAVTHPSSATFNQELSCSASVHASVGEFFDCTYFTDKGGGAASTAAGIDVFYGVFNIAYNGAG